MGVPCMKRSFIRALWGEVSNYRNGKIAKEIEGVNIGERDWFTIYVFGKENKKWLDEIGYNTILVDISPVVWDLKTEMYRHKLEVFERATEDFDEFAFLDWDCIPASHLDGVWDELGKKESFQANLFQYRTKKCLWRDGDQRKVCNGGFAYFRDKSIPEKMIKNWEVFCEEIEEVKTKRAKRGLELRFREKSLIFDDEPAMSKYVDDYCGGWQGVDHYWKNFEPTICNLRRKSVYSQELLDSKDCRFVHML